MQDQIARLATALREYAAEQAVYSARALLEALIPGLVILASEVGVLDVGGKDGPGYAARKVGTASRRPSL